MSTFAPPARRGDFLYSSVLYADAGDSNHHARASVAELAALLRPEAPKLYSQGRKPELSSPAKDPPWHYYSSQLIHYGLAVTKNKNTAKVRLLDAMNQFKLEVPAWVLKVEGELKKEWEAENRKIKKSLAAGAKSGEKSSVAKPKAVQGGKNDVNVTGKLDWGITSIQTDGSSVNISMSSDLSTFNGNGTKSTVKSTSTKPPSTKRKLANDDPVVDVKTPKKASKPTTDSTPAKRVKKDPVPKQIDSTPAKRVKKEPIPKQTTARVKQEQAPSSPANAPKSRVKKEPGYPQRAPAKPSARIKPDSYAQHESSSNLIILSGLYEIDCPAATDMFGDYDLNLTLARDTPRDCWWATFRWGAWDGIMQMNPGPILDEPASLGWRMRDLETGQLRFGKKCTGQITCYSDQIMGGELYEVPGVGTVEFQGRRMPGEALGDDLQHEWDAFVSEAYRR
jgi:hypothetical protein